MARGNRRIPEGDLSGDPNPRVRNSCSATPRLQFVRPCIIGGVRTGRELHARNLICNSFRSGIATSYRALIRSQMLLPFARRCGNAVLAVDCGFAANVYSQLHFRAWEQVMSKLSSSALCKTLLDRLHFDVVNRPTGPLFIPDKHSYATLEIFRFVARTDKAARDPCVRVP